MTFDAADPSTSNALWIADVRFAALAPLDLSAVSSAVVLAAHPDDETLGAGGLIASLIARGVPVRVVIVTDGAASHGSALSVAELVAQRATEVRTALRVLGAPAPLLLGYADGRVREDASAIEDELRRILATAGASTLVVAPWRGDGHRDHRVLGEIAATVATALSLRLVEYPIWLWHWATPADPAVPWSSMRALALRSEARQAKRQALAAFVSQTSPRRDSPALLRPDFLENFDRSSEVFVVDEGGTASP